MLTNPSREMSRQSIQSRLFIGTVIDNNDPKRLQRVRVQCPDMWDGVEMDDLPWFMPIQSAVMGNRPGMGTLSPLAKGSRVWVGFLDETPHFPVVWGSATTEDTHIAELTGADYPHCYGHVDQAGNIFLVNTAAGTITITHASGTGVSIDAGGNVVVGGAGNISVHAAGNVDVRAGGNAGVQAAGNAVLRAGGTVEVTGGGQINLNAGSINLNGGGGGGVEAPAPVTPRSRPA